MGNATGHLERGFGHYFHPEVYPTPVEDPTFDPMLGFEGGRKPREMIATDEQMRSAKIPLEDRDYCAHLLIKFRDCRREYFPWVVRCEHEKHEYLNCQYDDYLLRMKEYERERRLRVREQKLRKAAGA